MEGNSINVFVCVIVFLQPGWAYVGLMSNVTDVSELQCLRDLPVDHLLKIRRALQLLSAEDIAQVSSENRIGFPIDGPQDAIGEGTFINRSVITAMPLIGNPFKKMSWEPWAEEKPSKIQKFFQLSITALTFLAFGGYLLCMIVQAIKSKGTTYFYPSVQSTVRKRRPGRRDRRNTLDDPSNDTGADNQAEPSPDDLYQVLIMAAEGYVRLNQR